MMADCDSVMLEPPTVTPLLVTGMTVGAVEEEDRIGDHVGDWSTTTDREGKEANVRQQCKI